jgi:hypothetical protein
MRKPTLAVAALLLLTPLLAAQGGYVTGPPAVQTFYFSFTWNPGSNVNECYANCYPACLSACYSAGAGLGGSGPIDCSACGGACAGGKCVALHQNYIQADDAHPIGGTGITAGDDFSPIEPDQPPAGVEEKPLNCPAGTIAYSNLGCVDPNWKNNYCAPANNCGRCAGLSGCLWTGVSCVACNAPTCIFTCPALPGALPQRTVAQPQAIPTPEVRPPLPGPAPAPTPIATVIPIPTLVPTVTVPPGGGPPRPTVVATTTPVATVLPTPPPLPTPTPGPRCERYRECKECANAPKDKKGEEQCGWSDFAGACIDGEQWRKVNNASLKAGWVTEERYCLAQDDPTVYCYQFDNCFSCAGNGGLKRRCQWSVEDDRCIPYNPIASFRSAENEEGNDVLLPQFCPVRDCGQYTACRPCTANAACLWNRNRDECVAYEGEAEEGFSFYPSNCPATATPEPTPTPGPCPTDCKCDRNSRVQSCGGARVNATSLVATDRAVRNAGARGSLERVERVDFDPSGPSPAYTVRGSRSGVLFFFLPVQLPVTATVNAKTGAVEKVDQPWWSFLAG